MNAKHIAIIDSLRYPRGEDAASYIVSFLPSLFQVCLSLGGVSRFYLCTLEKIRACVVDYFIGANVI